VSDHSKAHHRERIWKLKSEVVLYQELDGEHPRLLAGIRDSVEAGWNNSSECMMVWCYCPCTKHCVLCIV
jgi:hypothetical protein